MDLGKSYARLTLYLCPNGNFSPDSPHKESDLLDYPSDPCDPSDECLRDMDLAPFVMKSSEHLSASEDNCQPSTAHEEQGKIHLNTVEWFYLIPIRVEASNTAWGLAASCLGQQMNFKMTF